MAGRLIHPIGNSVLLSVLEMRERLLIATGASLFICKLCLGFHSPPLSPAGTITKTKQLEAQWNGCDKKRACNRSDARYKSQLQIPRTKRGGASERPRLSRVNNEPRMTLEARASSPVGYKCVRTVEGRDRSTQNVRENALY